MINAGETKQAIINGTVLTMDQQWTEFEQGMVVINGATIAEIGPYDHNRLDKLQIPQSRCIDAQGGIIIPGLVNTHTHIGMSLFRSIADDRPIRLKEVIFPLERSEVTSKLVYVSSLHSLTEMILGGTTCFADMYYFSSETARSARESGIRGIIGQAVASNGGPDAPDFLHAVELVEHLREFIAGEKLLQAAIAPHAPYSLTKHELIKCASLSETYDLTILSHLAEMPFEESFVVEHHGLRPIPFYNQCGLLNQRSTMAHCIFASQEDRKLLIETQTGIAHNPSANSKSGKGIAPAFEFYVEGARIGLGTDGPMSGNTMDLIHQLGITAKLQKVRLKNATVMTPRQVLRCATIGGAEALHMEKITGSLEIGKQADIAVIGTKNPSLFPIYDPYAAIVYSASPSDVILTMVDGKVLMRNHKLTTLDDQIIRKESYDFVNSIRKRYSHLLGS
jgi:cytosine/adenosine deaminase-related metal-dependent hydrolase